MASEETKPSTVKITGNQCSETTQQLWKWVDRSESPAVLVLPPYEKLNAQPNEHPIEVLGYESMGQISSAGIQMVLVFDKPPSVIIATDEKGNKHLQLPFVVEKRTTAGKVVITTPDGTNGDFLIPDCTPTTQSFDKPKLSLHISKFQDYPGDFKFNIQIESSPPDQHQMKIHDMDFFSDGSEYHIYGHVKLFGATITNTEKDPLVLRLSGDRYEYVSGKGTATTAGGQTLQFGN
jgi:hypothetical protein